MYCDTHNVGSVCVIPRIELVRLSSVDAEKFVRSEARLAIKEMEEGGCDCDKDEYSSWNDSIV
jgi:hypothetical protein